MITGGKTRFGLIEQVVNDTPRTEAYVLFRSVVDDSMEIIPVSFHLPSRVVGQLAEVITTEMDLPPKDRQVTHRIITPEHRYVITTRTDDIDRLRDEAARMQATFEI